MKFSFGEQKKIQARAKTDIQANIVTVGNELRQEMKRTLEVKIDRCQKKCDQLEKDIKGAKTNLQVQSTDHFDKTDRTAQESRSAVVAVVTSKAAEVQGEVMDVRRELNQKIDDRHNVLSQEVQT